jgi:hypothetical protein
MPLQQFRKTLKDLCFDRGVNNNSIRILTLVHLQTGTNVNKRSLVKEGSKPEQVPSCVCVGGGRACVSTNISSLFPHIHALTTVQNPTDDDDNDGV